MESPPPVGLSLNQPQRGAAQGYPQVQRLKAFAAVRATLRTTLAKPTTCDLRGPSSNGTVAFGPQEAVPRLTVLGADGSAPNRRKPLPSRQVAVRKLQLGRGDRKSTRLNS